MPRSPQRPELNDFLILACFFAFFFFFLQGLHSDLVNTRPAVSWARLLGRDYKSELEISALLKA